MAVTKQAPVTHLSIVGAGTMGSGIALAALYAGWRVRLCDLSTDVLDQAERYVETYLARKGLEGARKLLSLHQDLNQLAPADLWIEAAPEDLGIKLDIFSQLDSIADPAAILATNTSTLSVNSMAASTDNPERVVGMHFFNPAAVMPLVELVVTEQADGAVVKRARQAISDLGKSVVVVADSPGFIVNRVARPFYGEALQLLGEGLATVEQIDGLVEGFGFPMGPFRLMDFIGNDVNLAASRSVYEQTFLEPRYRPHIIQQRLVRSGKLGKKTGQGFYRYPRKERESLDPADPSPSSAEIYVGSTEMAPGLDQWFRSNEVPLAADPSHAQAALLAAKREQDLIRELEELEQTLPDSSLIFIQAVTAGLGRLRRHLQHPARLIGFDSMCMAQGEVVALVASSQTSAVAKDRIEALFQGWGKKVVWVTEGPGMVLSRIMAMLVNEAAFAVQEGVASIEDIDRAMKLGANYPWGPLAWGKEVGYRIILEVLDFLRQEQGDPRYRAALILRRWAQEQPLSS